MERSVTELQSSSLWFYTPKWGNSAPAKSPPSPAEHSRLKMTGSVLGCVWTSLTKDVAATVGRRVGVNEPLPAVYFGVGL